MDIDIEKAYAAQQKLKKEVWESVKEFQIETGLIPTITMIPTFRTATNGDKIIIGNEVDIKINTPT